MINMSNKPPFEISHFAPVSIVGMESSLWVCREDDAADKSPDLAINVAAFAVSRPPRANLRTNGENGGVMIKGGEDGIHADFHDRHRHRQEQLSLRRL